MEAMEAKEAKAISPISPTISQGHDRGVMERAVEHATIGAHHKIDSMSSSGKPAVDRMAASAHEAVDKVSSVASHAVETLGVKGEQLNAAEKRLVAGTRQYVQQHPVASIGIAIATGYVLSRMFASR
jgi:ElaB/YqjD/DUF883 family membrane-anchored ribosome-binding protein